LEEKLRESAVIVVTLRAVAISFNPFRMLGEERIVHLSLKPLVIGNFNA
jgi:hypothetical protein